MELNYSAIYVMLATIFMVMVHVIAPNAILALVMVLLVPLFITIGIFDFFESHKNNDEWTCNELEEYDTDPDHDSHVSLMR